MRSCTPRLREIQNTSRLNISVDGFDFVRHLEFQGGETVARPPSGGSKVFDVLIAAVITYVAHSPKASVF